MAQPDVTKRIENTEQDLHAMRLREDIAELSRQLRELSPPAPADATARARCVALEKKLDELRKDLIDNMKKTDRLG
ncbi:MAG: hypothetical protein H0V44_05900 [Planctomycetes bacterium]|nr:hypothetical protein [Planctomycetota bacterium]